MRFKSRSRALAASALAASLGLSGLALTASPAQAEPAEIIRVAGATRYGTAAAAADRAYPDGATNVVLASGEAFPDALSAGGFAGSLDAPILLTPQAELDDATLSGLESLGAENVFVMGGTAAVSETVVDALEEEGYTVERIAGDDRFETAAITAEEIGGTTRVLANGFSFADALAISPGAHKLELPILLTGADELNADAAAGLEPADTVVIVGGTAVVSQEIEDDLEADGKTVVRLAGPTRYESAVRIAEFHFDRGFDDDELVMATGENFADALAGGPLASQLNAPLVLTQTSVLTPATQEFIESIAPALDTIYILGGTAAITDAVAEAASEAADEAAGGQEGVITSVNTGGDTYTFTSGTQQVTVTYDSTNDVFTVDGNPASLAAFEAALTVGDEIVFVDDPTTGAADADQHNLTNRTAASYTSGTVGNVDTTPDTFVIIDPVSGVTLSDGKDYTGGIFFVDNVVVNEAGFEAAINEGDTVVIETDAAMNRTFRLTNQTVSGTVAAFDAATDQVRIGNLGDNPLTAQDVDYDWVDGAATNNYFIGGVAATEPQFQAALTVGDTLEYTRTANTQTFRLTNVAPPAVTGVLTNVFDTTDDTATLANGANDVTIDYTGVAQYRVDGIVVTEPQAEAAMTPGDTVNFTPDNPDTAANEGALSITNGTLAGGLADVRVVDNEFDVVNAQANVVYDNLPYDTAIFGGATRYFVNGTEVTFDVFEAYLADVAADTTPDDSIEVQDQNSAVGADISTNYRLTTDETI